MSPELFDPEKFNLKDCRPTKRSDRYAFGMVVYEVLSGQVPFAGYNRYQVVAKVLKDERPTRPQGADGMWFTDTIWSILEHCWRPGPGDRPKIKDVLNRLVEVSGSWTPPPPRIMANPPMASPPTGSSESSTKESTSEDEASSASQMDLPQPSQGPRLKGNPDQNLIRLSTYHTSALYYNALDYPRRSCQNGNRPDETWVTVDTNSASHAAEVAVSQDTDPQPAYGDLQPALPHDCSRVDSGDIVIHGDCPVRAGAFADVWEGSLNGAPVVIKSYRLSSATGSTHARMVRFR